MKFELGDVVYDTITEVRGKVTARVEYVTGSNRYQITYANGQGDLKEVWFDEDRLKGVQ